MQALPRPVKQLVLKCLGPEDVVAASESSHAWHAAGLAKELWRPLCARESPLLGLLKAAAPPCSWKRLFAQRRGLAQSAPWEVAGPVEDPPSDAGDYLLGVELTEEKTCRVLFAALAELGGPDEADICLIKSEAAAKGTVGMWTKSHLSEARLSAFVFRKLDGKAISLCHRIPEYKFQEGMVWFDSAIGICDLSCGFDFTQKQGCRAGVARFISFLDDFGNQEEEDLVERLSRLLSVLERPAEQFRWV
jgi:hypothetical protein